MTKDFDKSFKKAISAAAKLEKGKKGADDAEILAGIPRGVFADWWATEQEEKGRSFSGQRIDLLAPATPAWAKKWGREVAAAIVAANGGKSLTSLYQYAKGVGYPYDAEHFGYHLGMQVAGHGVSWTDDIKSGHREDIKLPYREFYR